MSSKSIVKMESLGDVMNVADVFFKSGFFNDIKSANQALVKIMAGAEMGIGAFASMNSFNIIQGKAVPNADLMATLIKRDPRYNYRVIEHTENSCEIVFFEHGEECGRSKFTMADASSAGLSSKDVWKKYPRNMLFARALSNGAKWYCPDAFPGAVYTPEELGQEVDENGALLSYQAPEPVIDGNTGEVVTAPQPSYDHKEAAVALGGDESDDHLIPSATMQRGNWWGDKPPSKPKVEVERPWSAQGARSALRYNAYLRRNTRYRPGDAEKINEQFENCTLEVFGSQAKAAEFMRIVFGEYDHDTQRASIVVGWLTTKDEDGQTVLKDEAVKEAELIMDLGDDELPF